MIYYKLDVYVLALDLVGKIYELTRSFPKSEMFGVTSQARRAACSVVFNIAEGSSRKSSKEYTHFLRVAQGSATELDAIFDVLIRIKLVNEVNTIDLRKQNYRIRKMLQSLIRNLESKS